MLFFIITKFLLSLLLNYFQKKKEKKKKRKDKCRKLRFCRSFAKRAHSSPLSAKYRRVFKGFRVEDSHINRKRKAADIESFRGGR